MHYPQSWNITIVFCLLHRNGVLSDKMNERVFIFFLTMVKGKKVLLHKNRLSYKSLASATWTVVQF